MPTTIHGRTIDVRVDGQPQWDVAPRRSTSEDPDVDRSTPVEAAR